MVVSPGGETPRFALIGAAGFVAPRHMAAIHAVGGELVAAVDPHDSVGVIDKHFPNAEFFTEIERFERHLDRLRREGRGVDYVSICSPNYLHDSHCRLAMRNGADAICEKPLTLRPWNLDALEDIESETGQRVNVCLQLRFHPAVMALNGAGTASLAYITPRGKWYERSWKGDPEKSGGLLFNIGIHFFDLLLMLYGPGWGEIITDDGDTMSGVVSFPGHNVPWTLSIDAGRLPPGHTGAFRELMVDGEPVDLSPGFTDLHQELYRAVLAGECPGIVDARPSVELIHGMTTA